MDGFVSLISRILLTFGLVFLLAWHAHALFADDVANWYLRTLYVVPMWERVGVVIFVSVLVIASPWSKWSPLKIAFIFIYFAQFQSYAIDYFALPPLIERTRVFPYFFERITVCDQAASWNFLPASPNGDSFRELPNPRTVAGEICYHPKQRYVLDLPYIVDFEPYHQVSFEYDQFGKWLDYLLDLPERLEEPPTFGFSPTPEDSGQML